MFLVKHFADRFEVPIKINEIARILIQRGFVSRVNFHKVDDPPDEAIGMLLHRKVITISPPYLADEEVADVMYASTWHPYLQRLVCAKELGHVCDVNGSRAATETEVSRLVKEIVIPPSALVEMAKISPQSVSDHAGIIFALATLVPLAAQKVIAPLFRDEKINAAQVSETFEIPEAYVPLVMEENWQKLLEALCK